MALGFAGLIALAVAWFRQRGAPAPARSELVAGAIVSGCKARKRQLVLGNVGRLSFWVSQLAPRARELLMRRSQRGEVPTAGS